MHGPRPLCIVYPDPLVFSQSKEVDHSANDAPWGPQDQMVSGIIDRAMNSENNWGKASALGAILLTATLVLYFIYNRLVGIDKIRFG